MTGRREPPNLPDPDHAPQEHPALGQEHRDQLAPYQPHLIRGKFRHRPLIAGTLAVRQHRDPLPPQTRHEHHLFHSFDLDSMAMLYTVIVNGFQRQTPVIIYDE